MIMCEWDAPEGHSGQCCVHLNAFVSYRRLSPQFQFSLSAGTIQGASGIDARFVTQI
jgi:hypothetical protein